MSLLASKISSLLSASLGISTNISTPFFISQYRPVHQTRQRGLAACTSVIKESEAVVDVLLAGFVLGKVVREVNDAHEEIVLGRNQICNHHI